MRYKILLWAFVLVMLVSPVSAAYQVMFSDAFPTAPAANNWTAASLSRDMGAPSVWSHNALSDYVYVGAHTQIWQMYHNFSNITGNEFNLTFDWGSNAADSRGFFGLFVTNTDCDVAGHWCNKGYVIYPNDNGNDLNVYEADGAGGLNAICVSVWSPNLNQNYTLSMVRNSTGGINFYIDGVKTDCGTDVQYTNFSYVGYDASYQQSSTYVIVAGNGTTGTPTAPPYIIEGNTYNASTIEGTLETFAINFTWTIADISNITAQITYFGDTYNATETSIHANYSRFTRNLVVSPATAIKTSKSFYWNFTYYNISSGNWSSVATSNYTQQVFQVYIYNCSTGNTSLTFILKDEDTNATINGDFNSVFDVSYTNVTRNYTISHTNKSNITICISPYFATYTTDAIIGYDAPTYSPRNYYLDNTIITNTTNTIYIYLAQNAENISVTLYDQNGNPLEDYFIKAYRWDYSCNCYSLVEMTLTNFDGEGLLHLILNNPFYKFTIERNANIYKETTRTKIYDTSIVFYISLEESISQTFKSTMSINYNFSFNTASNYFDFTYSDSQNRVTRGCLKVYTITGLAETFYNQSCTNAAGASLFVNVNNNTDTTYKAVASVRVNNEKYVLETLYRSFTAALITFGAYGLLLTLIIELILFFTAYWSPPVASILVPTGLVFTRLAGLHSMSWSILITLMALGAIIAYIISDKS